IRDRVGSSPSREDAVTSIALTPPDLTIDADPAPPPGRRLKIGGPEHKTLFCRTLLDTFNPYKPAVIDWPKLDDDVRGRLTSLPIWAIAVQPEGRASRNIASYAKLIRDPLLKRAVELNCFEEMRHKVVLSNLVEA